MYRRTAMSGFASGALMCLCGGKAGAQTLAPTLRTPTAPHNVANPPAVIPRHGPFCTFSRPATGGITIRSYDPKPGGGRGKSQIAWSLAGALPGVPDTTGTIRASFAAWRAPDAAPVLGFNQIARGGDVAVSGADLGAPNSQGLQILGQTADDGSTIKFNTRITWSTALLQRVATHEIGHALGLLHATTANSIMYPIDQGVNTLGPDDKSAIRALYGWSAQSQIEGGSLNSPALAACGGTLARAWRGSKNDDNIWFSTSTDGVHWTPQRTIPGAASAVGPSLAWDGSRLWMAWRGVNDDGNIYWANTGNFFNGNWTGVQKLGDRASSDAPSIAFAAGSMVMAWKGSRDDQGLYWSRFGGNWGSQQKIGGVGSGSAPALCQDLDPRAVRMVWRGVHDDHNLYTSTLSDLFWQPQQKVSWIVTGNGAAGTGDIGYPGTSDAPSVTFANDKLLLLWKGTPGDSGLYFTQYANGVVGGRTVTEWSGQAKIPNVGSSTGPAIAQFDGRLHAVWKGVGDDHAIWTATL